MAGAEPQRVSVKADKENLKATHHYPACELTLFVSEATALCCSALIDEAEVFSRDAVQTTSWRQLNNNNWQQLFHFCLLIPI